MQLGLSNPESWVDQYADYLYKYALLRLRDHGKAEDLVQDTFLTALKAATSFAGKSSERTWLVGILRNKIFDYFRKVSREVSFADLEFFNEEDSERFVAEGLGSGGWVRGLGPLEWPDPGASLDNQVFWKTFQECAQKLPKNINTAFCLREVDGLDTKEICAALNISDNNLGVMLHRARMALRRCLETN